MIQLKQLLTRVRDAANEDMTYEKMVQIWLPMQLEPGKSTSDQPSVTKSLYMCTGITQVHGAEARKYKNEGRVPGRRRRQP